MAAVAGRAGWLPAAQPVGGAARSRFAVPAALLGIVALGLALRFAWIDAQSFWLNELFSIFWVRQPLGFLWTHGMLQETNPPLYYTLLKFWVFLFGDSEMAARSLTALASTACIPLVFLLARAVSRRPAAALIAAAAIAVCPAQIYFADETRAYGLLAPLFAVVLLCLLRALRQDDAAAPRRAWNLAGFVLAASAMIYVHASSVFLLGATGLAFALVTLDQRMPWARLRPVLLAALAVAVLAAPELAVEWLQRRSPDIGWIPGLNLMTAAAMVRFPFFGPFPQWQYVAIVYIRAVWWEALLAAVMFIVVIAAARRSDAARAHVNLFAFIPLVFLACILGISLLRPMMLPRILIATTVPLGVLVGLALAGDAPPRVRLELAAFLTVSFAVGLSTVLSPAKSKPDWRAAIPALEAEAHPGDVVIAGPHASPLALELPYADALTERVAVRRWTMPNELRPTILFRLQMQLCGGCGISTDGLERLINSGRRVWVLLDGYDQYLWNKKLKIAAHLPPPRSRQRFKGVRLLGWGNSGTETARRPADAEFPGAGRAPGP